MKIGIDARLYGQTGHGRYISNLIRKLESLDTENDYIIFVTKEGSERYHPQNRRFKKWIADYSQYSIQEQTLFVIDLLRARLDLLHVPSFNAPVLYLRKLIITIHDLTMNEFNSSEATTLPEMLYSLKYAAYRAITWFSVFRSKMIIVPSETVKNDVVKAFSVKPSKLEVTYEGVDEELLTKSIKEPKALHIWLEEKHIHERYFLYVGSAYPHKNLDSLVVAYKDFVSKSAHKINLVIAGKADLFSERLAGYIHASGLDSRVIFAARYSEDLKVSDSDLANLYEGAFAYVFPSMKEGFSITPLEAQAFSVPVLLSDIPVHREVFGDSVLWFNPKSVIDFTERMLDVVNNPELHANLAAAGIANAQRYSWQTMAEKTLSIYNRKQNG